jgi:hypothetical protein
LLSRTQNNLLIDHSKKFEFYCDLYMYCSGSCPRLTLFCWLQCFHRCLTYFLFQLFGLLYCEYTTHREINYSSELRRSVNFTDLRFFLCNFLIKSAEFCKFAELLVFFVRLLIKSAEFCKIAELLFFLCNFFNKICGALQICRTLVFFCNFLFKLQFE